MSIDGLNTKTVAEQSRLLAGTIAVSELYCDARALLMLTGGRRLMTALQNFAGKLPKAPSSARMAPQRTFVDRISAVR
jgi:hypothetical protein